MLSFSILFGAALANAGEEGRLVVVVAVLCSLDQCRGTSLIRKRFLLGPCSRPVHRAMTILGGIAVSHERGYPVSSHPEQVLSFSILFGAALANAGEEGRPVVVGITAFNAVIMRMVRPHVTRYSSEEDIIWKHL